MSVNVAAIERNFLGCLLRSSPLEVLGLADVVTAEMITGLVHRKIYEAILFLADGGRGINDKTLKAFLPVEDDEGAPYEAHVSVLRVNGEDAGSAYDYAEDIRSEWKKRQFIKFTEGWSKRAANASDEATIDDLADQMDTGLRFLRYGEKPIEIITMAQAVTTAIDQTAKVYEGGAELGITSRIPDVAHILGPFMPGDMLTLLAASANGKTALAGQFMADAALPYEKREPVSSLMFSQEMLAVQIARRAIAAESGISTQRQRRASIDAADFDQLVTAARKLSAMPIYIDQTANQKVSQIVRKARHMKKLYGISFVIVDHLLEIRAEHPRDSKFDTIEHAALALKTLAKEENLVVLLLAQLTREGQKRDNWRVRSQDLFGGDAVKQRSDIMFSVAIPTTFIGEREPMMGTKEHFEWQDEMQKWHGKAEISALKMRDGENGGRVTVKWDGPRQTFSEFDDARLPLREAT